MRRFLSTYIYLIVILLIFIILKVPHLFYPHYWDEAWSYAPAIHAMYVHGPTLLPGALAAEVSRGHPLFFYAFAASWMKLFGTSLPAQHSFALFVSVAQLTALYVACNRLFNKRVAIIATVLLAAQVIFFVQSAMVLPEVLVGVLAFLTIYFYSIENFLFAFIFLTLLLLTKESGFVMGPLLAGDACIALFSKEVPRATKYKKLFTVAGAGIIIVIFFLLQHHAYGWYLFPGHTGLIDHSWPVVFGKLKTSISFFFADDKMYRVFWVPLLLSVIVAVWKKELRWLFYLIPALFIWMMVTGHHLFLGEKGLTFFIAASLLAAIILSAKWLGENKKGEKLLLLGGIFFLFYVTFSIFNFFTLRYLLAAFFWVIVFIAVWLDRMVSKISVYLYIPIALFLGFNAAKAYQYNTGLGDCSIQAFNAMNTQKDIVHYLDSRHLYDKTIGIGSFQQHVNLQDPATGFLQSSSIFKNVNYDIHSTTDIAIFDDIEYDDRYDKIKADSNFTLAYRTRHGGAWGEIYFNKKMK